MRIQAACSVLCVLLACGALRAQGFEERTLLAGSDQALWLIKASPARTFDLFRRPLGGRWESVVRELSGNPVAACDVDDQLHVIFRDPDGYLVFFGSNPQPISWSVPDDPIWPNCTVLAMCRGPDVEGVPTVIVLARHAPAASLPASSGASTMAATELAQTRASASAATAPAGQPVATAPALPATTRSVGASTSAGANGASRAVAGAAASAPAVVRTHPTRGPRRTRPTTLTTRAGPGPTSAITLCAFQRVQQRWVRLKDIDDVRLGQSSRVLATLMDDIPYVLISSADAGVPNRLLAWSEGQWQDRPLSEPIAGSAAIALRAQRGQLDLVLASAATDGSVRLTLAAQPPGAPAVYQPVRVNGVSAAWPPGRIPAAVYLGPRPALVWQEGQALRFSLCEPTGAMNPPTELTLAEQQPETDQEDLRTYVAWGVLLLVLLPLLLLRARPVTKAFALPQGVVPAPLGKRLLAALVDLVPFLILTTAVLYPQAIANPDLVRQQPMPIEMWYASLGGLLLYVVYCIIMEHRYGATLGKMLMRLRVVGDGGAKLSLREAFLRNLIKVLELTSPLLLPLFMLIPILSRYRQRLGDIMARTAVVDATVQPPQ